MRKAVVCTLALLAAGAVTPAFAGNVYVPIVQHDGVNGTIHETEIWISNGGGVDRRFATAFLPDSTDGIQRAGVVGSALIRVGGNGTFRLANTAPANREGLLEVDAAPQLLIGARLLSSVPNGGKSRASLPVISSDNMVAADATADVLGLERQGNVATHVSVVNLGKAAAQCDIALFRANGSQITAATVTLQPLSLRRFADVLASETTVADARARIKCNRAFYAFGTVADNVTGRTSFALPSASGASTLTTPTSGSTTDPPPTPAAGAVVFNLPGALLIPARGREVREEHFNVTKAMALKRMIIELDFTVGPWSTRDNGGPHAIIWLYRGTFRSNTIANVNVHGPTKNKIRMNQNVDLPGLSDTLAQQGGKYEIGSTYHFFYRYDAEANKVRCKVTRGSEVINDLEFAGSASRRTLNIPASGFDMVLGHRAGLEYEVPSYGWTYSNFRAELVPY